MTIDYEAAGTVLGTHVDPILKDGEVLRWDWIREAIDAALGDEPIYRIEWREGEPRHWMADGNFWFKVGNSLANITGIKGDTT